MDWLSGSHAIAAATNLDIPIIPLLVYGIGNNNHGNAAVLLPSTGKILLPIAGV
ncbi:MAG TPA: hypothetical protein PLQ65_09505 [Flavihumibacter sp.]|nr:hypothetical protein [Flavihumibacter sp.]